MPSAYINDSVGLYLNDIGKVSLLNAEEERELARAVELGYRSRDQLEEITSAGIGGLAVNAKLLDASQQKASEFIANLEPETPQALKAQRKSPYLKLLRKVIEIPEPLYVLRSNVAKGAAAKDRFIRSNLRLVVSIARRYPLPTGMDMLDLVQEGNLGLEHAVDKFEWQKGFKFSTYATFWIRQAIGRALDQKASLIRLPGDRSAALRAALRQASGEPDNLSSGNADLHRLTSPVSLDKSIGDDGQDSFGDLLASSDIEPEDQVMKLADSDLLDELLRTLDKRARYAVKARFGFIDGEKKSFREIGKNLGVTAEAARRLVGRSVAGLREDAARMLS